ncbi:hypothetical protein [Streptomyces alkaliterrae]|uniref:DUF2530 domain-containing protein n=1 Tax=Streptomyces alkaliterrae TaxID=2213162 RepID=A0A5P0YTP9_9ACTN|nr:hypothetical protein [Streptomyces alkaliterrae]MBB1255733.1 hypothetical protein [Streptomyces alkaliterrae]MBB1261627.1 hypothetical protein [Streptomyces alkaliterrae]MQS03693.1 hypothetical protein [Streptomyces alkaliterrae]
MTYSSTREWWGEVAVGVLAAVATTVLLALLCFLSLGGEEATVNLAWFAVPGLFVGLWVSRRYRRRRHKD